MATEANALQTADGAPPMALVRTESAVSGLSSFTPEQVDLIKRTVADGTSDDELLLFLEVCKSSGLNPFQKQIYAIMRQESYKDARGQWQKRAKMTIQTGIDGYRLIASRTGRHAGTSDVEFGPPDEKGYPSWARITVLRMLDGGRVAEFVATARWSEYCQTDRNGAPSGQWAKMPHTMLGKCVEALALRKAFPAELAGVYTKEEMMQADSAEMPEPVHAAPARQVEPRQNGVRPPVTEYPGASLHGGTEPPPREERPRQAVRRPATEAVVVSETPGPLPGPGPFDPPAVDPAPITADRARSFVDEAAMLGWSEGAYNLLLLKVSAEAGRRIELAGQIPAALYERALGWVRDEGARNACEKKAEQNAAQARAEAAAA